MKTTKVESVNRLNGNGHLTEEVVKAPSSREVSVPAPNFQTAIFHIKGNAPLVMHRFSVKTKKEFEQKMEEGKSSSSKKKRAAVSTEDIFNEGRYISKEGWDGFHAGSIRNAMIRACSLVNFKMTLAKMSLFVIADGVDKFEPQIPLIRIHGDAAIKQEDIGRVATGASYLIIRPAYHNWSAKIHLRWDADQFSLTDVSNLLSRVGIQVGIGEGRPSSKDSAGMGWGTFDIVKQ